MKKLIMVLIVAGILFVSGCGPSCCDRSSPDYDPYRCSSYMQALSNMNQQMQLQTQQQRMQYDISSLQQQQFRNSLSRP
jgi:hypothetical protein